MYSQGKRGDKVEYLTEKGVLLNGSYMTLLTEGIVNFSLSMERIAMKRIHMEDKITGVEWCGSVEMDKDLSNDLRRQADEGNTQALNELADMIIFHEEVENYENYIKKAE